MISLVWNTSGLGVVGKLLASRPNSPTLSSSRRLANVLNSKLGLNDAVCRKTHVCSSPSGDGWFQGLLASEKKRPCTEALLVLSRDGTKQASKIRATGQYVDLAWHIRPGPTGLRRESLTNRTPFLLRAIQNRRRKIHSSPKSRGNVPCWKKVQRAL